MTRGMTPITKNIVVLDEQGNTLEATYAKRAKGLVKHGRARFVDENTICLACPPNMDLEDRIMNENRDQIANPDYPAQDSLTPSVPDLTIEYLLSQIDKIVVQTDHLHQAIAALGEMGDGDNAEGMSPGNTLGQAKATAIGDVDRCRETTNQQLLKLYEKMYDDLRPVPVSEDMQKLQQLAKLVEGMPAELAGTVLQKASQQMFVRAGCAPV